MLSTTLENEANENEAIATVENEATQTDWMGDLSGGLGIDPQTRRGWGSELPLEPWRVQLTAPGSVRGTRPGSADRIGRRLPTPRRTSSLEAWVATW